MNPFLANSSRDYASLPLACPSITLSCSPTIGGIEGELPVYQAVGGAAWPVFVEEVLSDLAGLIRSLQFGATPFSLLERLDGWSRSPDVVALAERDVRLIHADLTGDNLFLLEGRPKVIDWQYPRIGPASLDVANLLLSLGIDPRPHTPPAAVEMLYFVRLGWLTACAARWFPPGVATYERQISALAERILKDDGMVAVYSQKSQEDQIYPWQTPVQKRKIPPQRRREFQERNPFVSASIRVHP